MSRRKDTLGSGEVSKRFDRKRFDAAVKAATRDLGPEIQAEVAKAIEAGRAAT